jgi:hypothetical protein
MLEVALTVCFLVIGFFVACRVLISGVHRVVIPPSVATLPGDEEVKKLEGEVFQKADSVLQTLSGVMSELRADEAKLHDVSDSDTMRSIARKVESVEELSRSTKGPTARRL